MKNRTVTVIGATGFLGRHAVRALAKAGWRIKAASRHPARGFFLRPMGSVGQIELVKCDVADADSVAAVLKGADAVVNLTGILFEKGQTFEDVQAAGATHVADAAAAAGITALVHVSAIGADRDSESVYARTKAEGEESIRQAVPGAVILRPSIVFGPEDGFFNKFAGMARFLPALPLIGGGKTRFQPVFVGDVATAIVTALDSQAARGRTFELGGPGIYSFRELMEIILKETGRRRALVPVPFGIAMLKAAFLQLLPSPVLTMDQVRLLKKNNIVTAGAPGLLDLGITATSVEAVVPSYLWRYRAKGEYAQDAAQA
ncbi:MAG: complex I NDUFA9 subunit family protein [Alphaproteobacteria bacterium 64-11]|nr:complex I NDUFA9 subunit family protein [Alphaproteobacteria bacterium]OJU11042.1 MAG: complex I NDUFA9 subunit family protein [Alphaproteobacteria bacterium 64-11]